MVAGLKLPIRLRKLIGTIVLVPYTIVYALVIMALAVRLVPQETGLVAALFFLGGGLLWLPVPMVLIWWMSRP